MSDISDAELRCRLELKLKNLIKARNVRKQKIVQTKRFQSKPKPVAPKSPSVCDGDLKRNVLHKALKEMEV